MKINSVIDLEDFISSEYAWRRKELTNIKNIVMTARQAHRDLLLRAAVLILYAHWEGFVKQISIAKIQYLVSSGIKYHDLAPAFHAYAVLEKYKGQIPYKSFETIVSIVAGGIDLSNSIKVSPEKYIDTRSNLNSEVLKEIVIKVNLDYAYFELKENFIDKSFLGLRNKISHGERVNVSPSDFEIIYNEAMELIDQFKMSILNSVFNKTYLKKVIP